jgi:hypothetical protein
MTGKNAYPRYAGAMRFCPEIYVWLCVVRPRNVFALAISLRGLMR